MTNCRPLYCVLAVALTITLARADTCQKLAICALDKCIPQATGYPPIFQTVDKMLQTVNFGCILGPMCYNECAACDSCKYAQDQIKNLLLKEETVGRCPKLESCARSCLEDQVLDPFSCVFKSRCAHHCLDEDDCPPCRDVVKRVFTGYCYRNGFIDHYQRKCKPMFDEVARDYVKNHA
ncbi:unnamed protein product [Bursaphelenchus xylophilus]|uniref:(pine wood nematode) hypothetical protein n=1 Tax=Bursaphelenchus xylophilus TaxID=6326 RepID=A0A1I7S9M2_BURXY|nr:unnamed protein product [Bursaphelenchus xylophilus]CAG9131933.1 unnamed protein product [Bursaphelenchus xylophilus]